MNQQKFVGIMLIISVAFAFFIAIVLAPITNPNSWYTLDGLLFFVFGIWGGILLVKDSKLEIKIVEDKNS